MPDPAGLFREAQREVVEAIRFAQHLPRDGEAEAGGRADEVQRFEVIRAPIRLETGVEALILLKTVLVRIDEIERRVGVQLGGEGIERLVAELVASLQPDQVGAGRVEPGGCIERFARSGNAACSRVELLLDRPHRRLTLRSVHAIDQDDETGAVGHDRDVRKKFRSLDRILLALARLRLAVTQHRRSRAPALQAPDAQVVRERVDPGLQRFGAAADVPVGRKLRGRVAALQRAVTRIVRQRVDPGCRDVVVLTQIPGAVKEFVGLRPSCQPCCR